MNRRQLTLAIVAIIIVTIIVATALFIIYTPKDNKYDGIPTIYPYVTDDTYVLYQEDYDHLQALCEYLESNNSCEVAVLIINETGKYDLNTFAIRVFEKNGIGQQGKDNGVLVCFLVNDTDVRWRVVTGAGVEGILNGAKLKSFENDYLIPTLETNDTSWAIRLYVDAIVIELDDKYISEGVDPWSSYPVPFIPLNGWQLALAIVILVVLTIITRGRILFFLPYLFRGKGGQGGWGGGGTGGGGSRGRF